MSLPYNLSIPPPPDANHVLIATAMYEADMTGSLTDWSLASAGVQLRCRQSYTNALTATLTGTLAILATSATLSNPSTLLAPPPGFQWQMTTSAGDQRLLTVSGSSLTWIGPLSASATATIGLIMNTAVVSAGFTIGQTSATLLSPTSLATPPPGYSWQMETQAGDIRTLTVSGSTISWTGGLSATAPAIIYDLYVVQLAPTKGITSVRLPFAQHYAFPLLANLYATLTLGAVMTGVGNAGNIWNTTLQGELIKR